MSASSKKAVLHELVDDLPEAKVETARRFLESLRAAQDTTNFIARFLESMDARDAALLDGLAELDREQGEPAFVADRSDESG